MSYLRRAINHAYERTIRSMGEEDYKLCSRCKEEYLVGQLTPLFDRDTEIAKTYVCYRCLVQMAATPEMRGKYKTRRAP